MRTYLRSKVCVCVSVRLGRDILEVRSINLKVEYRLVYPAFKGLKCSSIFPFLLRGKGECLLRLLVPVLLSPASLWLIRWYARILFEYLS